MQGTHCCSDCRHSERGIKLGRLVRGEFVWAVPYGAAAVLKG